MARPINLNANYIIEKCMLKYWEKGINSFSFNSIIKYSGVSKPSMYRLVGDEDNLKYRSLKLYYQKNLVNFHHDIENATNLYEFIRKILENIKNKKNGITDFNKGLCYFQKTRIIKYTLDKKTKYLISRIDSKFLKSYLRLINKLKTHGQIDKSLNSEYLAQYIYNSITFFVNTVQNSLSTTEIDNIKKSILNMIENYVK